MPLVAYVAQDRRSALARGESLPDRAPGAALFADISGFTPLTEKLTRQFGARRGGEELTKRVNAVYDALIRSVEAQGGSVVDFAGDAITCWLSAANPNASLRALAAAQAMQTAMSGFPDLALKVAVTSGTARRLVAGDPRIQLLDTLAGGMIARLAVAEHLARPGEVVADAATLRACGGAFAVTEWRADPETGEPFAVVHASLRQVETMPAVAPSAEIPSETLRAWVLPAVYAREQSGLSEFLTELRPAVALFLRFGGIDYDGDDSAQEKLDSWIREVQHAAARYDGTLLQLTIGDKGSYLYVCFGAPTSHEDDARRAVQTALELREKAHTLPYLEPVQVGISRGTLRAGACGSATRRTYAALGDEVNVAARLMSVAAPGEIVVSEHVQQALGERFTLTPRPPVTLKGKSGLLTVFTVIDSRHRRAIGLLEPEYRLPMIGRAEELAFLESKLELARQGQGQIVGITAEAGMGKSRLVAEVIQLARQHDLACYSGACESSGTNTAYLVWKPIWQAFFDLDPAAPAPQQLRHIKAEIASRAPFRLQALPLLARLLDFEIEENDFTRTLEPRDRRNALEALLEDCLKAAAKEEPILFVLEDAHWIDPLSHDLLESLARATANARVCFVLAYRPPETVWEQTLRVQALPNFSSVALNELTPAEAGQLIRAKLAQLYPGHDSTLPGPLLGKLTDKAQGNPFFLEELLNYLRDRGIDPWELGDTQSLLELPSSLHTLILSRVDRLTETQKATLKVASIIGRLFPFAWLRGYYPALGELGAIKADLAVLSRLDITPLDIPEPEPAYLFKHNVTWQVAYESLEYGIRARWHEQLARYLEGQDAAKVPYQSPLLDLVAFHYGRSENVAKKREYFRKAGEAAQAAYANTVALEYYDRLHPLLTDDVERADLHLRWGAVLDLLGRWDEAEAHYQEALARVDRDAARTVFCQKALGKLCRRRGDYAAALAWLEKARQGWAALNDRAGMSQVLLEIGIVLSRQGDDATAEPQLKQVLTLAREMGDKAGIAASLGNLGGVAYKRGDYATARALTEECLLLRREIGDKLDIAASLSNLGVVVFEQGDYATARTLHEESLLLRRTIGDKLGIAISLSNLAGVAHRQGDHKTARARYVEALALRREIGDKAYIPYSLIGLASVAAGEGRHILAAQLASYAENLRSALKFTFEPWAREMLEQVLASAQAALGEEAFNAACQAGRSMTLDMAVDLALD